MTITHGLCEAVAGRGLRYGPTGHPILEDAVDGVDEAGLACCRWTEHEDTETLDIRIAHLKTSEYVSHVMPPTVGCFIIDGEYHAYQYNVWNIVGVLCFNVKYVHMLLKRNVNVIQPHVD